MEYGTNTRLAKFGLSKGLTVLSLFLGFSLATSMAWTAPQPGSRCQDLFSRGPHESKLQGLDELAAQAEIALERGQQGPQFGFQPGLKFLAADGTLAGQIQTQRISGQGLRIKIEMPRLRNGVDARDFVRAAAVETIQRAQELGYSEIEIVAFAQWNKGNQQLRELGFKPDPRDANLFRQELKSQTKSERLATPALRQKYLESVAQIIESQKEQISQILSRVNTPTGTDWEIYHVLGALRHAPVIEGYDLDRIQTVNHLAVVASTNVPLYSLIVQGFIPSLVAKHTWFRTPSRTREVYRDLYSLISQGLPPAMNQGFHLLMDEADTQYDNFLRRHILGLNNNRNAFARNPSELVLFTGNPNTGQKLVQEIATKFREVDADRALKQVFIGFGAGMNPMVVASSARENMPRAVKAVIENIRMNSAQDCSLPNFYAVHELALTSFVDQLTSAVRQLRPGPHTDPQAGYSPLSMTDDLRALANYRQKYFKYLKNSEAVFDMEKRLVAPHVFVFPPEMYAQVELQEHFAPFITVFPFRDRNHLKRMMAREEVRKQAMAATVFGGEAASRDLTETIQEMRESGHSVTVNKNLYSYLDYGSNLPFGGAGVETSFVYTLTKPKGGEVHLHRAHHPVLFSNEAAIHFPKRRDTGLPTVSELPVDHQYLQTLLAEATAPVRGWNTTGVDFPEMLRPTGIKYLQEVAKKGFYVASTYAMMFRSSEYGFNANVANPMLSPEKVRGLVLHATAIDQNEKAFKTMMGDVNPQMGFGRLMDLIRKDRAQEYRFTEAAWPGLMPKTETWRSLADQGRLPVALIEQVASTKAEFERVLRRGQTLDTNSRELLRAHLEKLVDQLFQWARREFPEGVYFKNYSEFATGDLGTGVTSFSTSHQEVVGEFLRRFEQVLSEIRSGAIQGGADLKAPSLRKAIVEGSWESYSKFIFKLLADPQNLQVQSRVTLAQTPLGFAKEFRVDFIDGEAVLARHRFGSEYLPDDAKAAAQVVNAFFKRLPPEFRQLAGGADVAQTTDGRWIVFEWNLGPNSGTLMSGYYPIESHLYFSTLRGEPTPFLQKLHRVHREGVTAEARYLRSLRHEKSVWWRESEQDYSVEDIGKYFRDLHLAEWDRGPKTAESRQEILRQIHVLFEGFQSEAIQKLRDGASYFVQTRLDSETGP